MKITHQELKTLNEMFHHMHMYANLNGYTKDKRYQILAEFHEKVEKELNK